MEYSLNMHSTLLSESESHSDMKCFRFSEEEQNWTKQTHEMFSVSLKQGTHIY